MIPIWLIIHHDNARVHTALFVNRYLTSQWWDMALNPPFSSTKKNRKGKRFDDLQSVNTALQRVLDDIKVEEFQICF